MLKIILMRLKTGQCNRSGTLRRIVSSEVTRRLPGPTDPEGFRKYYEMFIGPELSLYFMEHAPNPVLFVGASRQAGFLVSLELVPCRA